MQDRPHDEGIQPELPADYQRKPLAGELPRFEAVFSLRVEDALAFQEVARAGKRGGRSSLWWTLPVLALLIGFLALPDILANPGKNDIKSTLILAVAVLVFGGFVFGRPLQRAALRRNLLSNPRFTATRRVVLTPEAVEHYVGPTSARTMWQGVTRVQATPTHLFLFTGPAEAIVVPGRAFVSQDDFEDFIEAAEDFHREARRRRDKE